jgi:hypothetical protein
MRQPVQSFKKIPAIIECKRLFSHILLLSEKSQKPDFSPAYYDFRSERREKLFSLLLNRVFSGSLLHNLSELISDSNKVYEKSHAKREYSHEYSPRSSIR